MPNTPTTQKEYVIPLENRPGTLTEVTSALGKANVNILGYLLEAQGDFGVFRFTTNEPGKTESWLKSTNRPYRANDVITVPVPNNPGELGRITSTLAKSGVNVLGSYPSSINNQIGLTFAVNDIATAKKVLQG